MTTTFLRFVAREHVHTVDPDSVERTGKERFHCGSLAIRDTSFRGEKMDACHLCVLTIKNRAAKAEKRAAKLAAREAATAARGAKKTAKKAQTPAATAAPRPANDFSAKVRAAIGKTGLDYDRVLAAVEAHGSCDKLVVTKSLKSACAYVAGKRVAFRLLEA